MEYKLYTDTDTFGMNYTSAWPYPTKVHLINFACMRHWLYTAMESVPDQGNTETIWFMILSKQYIWVSEWGHCPLYFDWSLPYWILFLYNIQWLLKPCWVVPECIQATWPDSSLVPVGPCWIHVNNTFIWYNTVWIWQCNTMVHQFNSTIWWVFHTPSNTMQRTQVQVFLTHNLGWHGSTFKPLCPYIWHDFQ